ncbi:MAG TPA: enoyl-CoA hydratase/isomerase family protein [Candidatus Dormibacteraeota bacterium]|nr:enoyl-CoA hydratase/isomerase family protein [Candidatus Dormibacteraeota bacterium]
MRDLRVEIARGVATIAIDRPHARNALALRTMAELDEALAEARSKRARVVVVRGAGDRAFCAGGDLKELEHMRSGDEAAAMARQMRATLDAITAMAVPVIGAVNGDAFGGGAELALACDFRIAAAHARIGFTQISLGLMPAWGASERLAALVGRGRALHLLLAGRVLSAQEAVAVGLVEEVVASDDFDARVRELARQIAAAPPAAVAGIKRSVDAIRPHRHPELADEAIETFTRTWVAPAHWRAVERMEKRRKKNR